jgi:hypothetical protein
MSSEKPYVKWYGRDWLGDSTLRMLEVSDRGVWIDMLCIMMSGEPYGHLAVNGVRMAEEQVARIIGLDVSTYKTHVKRLIALGVPSVTSDGVIYSRRLVKDHKKFQDGRKNGLKGGGNPALTGLNKDDSEPESTIQNPEAKGGLKVPFIGDEQNTYIGTESESKDDKPKSKQERDFDEFWKIYPRKKAKDAAFRAWIKSKSKPDLTVILSSVKAQMKSVEWMKEGGRFIPYPATWINSGCWHDEVTAPASRYVVNQIVSTDPNPYANIPERKD